MALFTFQTRPANEALRVDLDNEVHERYIGKSREKGERELRELVDKSNVEESWFYIEGEDEQGKTVSVWYEIGERESATGNWFAGLHIFMVAKDLAELKIKPKRVANYHIHPNITPEEVPEVAEVFRQKHPAARWREAWNIFLNSFSEADLGMLGGTDAVFRSEFAFGMAATYRVVVPTGMWAMSLNWNRLRQKIEEGGFGQYSEMRMVAPYTERLSKLFEQYRLHCALPTTWLGELPIIGYWLPIYECPPEEIIDEFSSEDLSLSFTPR